MVPKEHWAAIFILAAIIQPDLQTACDERGFIWARSLENDVKRPRPSFPEARDVDPRTGEEATVKGD